MAEKKLVIEITPEKIYLCLRYDILQPLDFVVDDLCQQRSDGGETGGCGSIKGKRSWKFLFIWTKYSCILGYELKISEQSFENPYFNSKTMDANWNAAKRSILEITNSNHIQEQTMMIPVCRALLGSTPMAFVALSRRRWSLPLAPRAQDLLIERAEMNGIIRAEGDENERSQQKDYLEAAKLKTIKRGKSNCLQHKPQGVKPNIKTAPKKNQNSKRPLGVLEISVKKMNKNIECIWKGNE